MAGTAHMPRGWAQTPPPNQELNQLIGAGQFEQAYQLAISNLTEWEGDTEFDFIYGIAAIESGSPNEAVFAFERVALTAEDPTLRQRRQAGARTGALVDQQSGGLANAFHRSTGQQSPSKRTRQYRSIS